MTQKQTIGVVVGVLVIGLMFVFVYRQLATPIGGEKSLGLENQQQMKTTASQQSQKLPEPETIDDISQSIKDETAMDLSALDDEANGEISEIEADSDSINNLGTSYDENSL